MKEYCFEIKGKDAGKRLDQWLVGALKLPRGKIKRLLDTGRILVNNRRVVIAGWELEQNDYVVARVPNEVPREKTSHEEKSPQKRGVNKNVDAKSGVRDRVRKSAFRNIGKPTLSYKKLGEMKERSTLHTKQTKEAAKKEGEKSASESRFLKVYYQDRDLIVVEKPAGILTVPQNDSNHPHMLGQIQSFLRRKYRRAKHSYLRPLHRLDNDTSGVLVFATSKAGENLAWQFKKHNIDRRYIALVHGSFQEDAGKIDTPLEKGNFGGGKKVRVTRDRGAKTAKTFFRVKERYENATYLDVSVSTGRTHQVRVHFASRGNPLIGDKLYSDHRGERIPFKRHALHASFLSFKHPVTGKKLSFRSPLPKDMKELIDKLRGV